MRSSLVSLLCAIFIVGGIEHISAKAQSPGAAPKPVIVSQTHPKDSQGETVYDEQDAAQANAPVVPGVLVHPKFLKAVKPKIPMSARMHHRKVDIVIEGVVTAKGDVIDVHVLHDDGEPDLAEKCAKAFGADRLKPATLDGKPVAVLLQVPFSFNVF
jgi:outer membrane biosynthesis protein TonB